MSELFQATALFLWTELQASLIFMQNALACFGSDVQRNLLIIHCSVGYLL